MKRLDIEAVRFYTLAALIWTLSTLTYLLLLRWLFPN